MKKYILTIVSILCILSFVGCGKKEKFERGGQRCGTEKKSEHDKNGDRAGSHKNVFGKGIFRDLAKGDL